jgi:hypothetical protein
MRGNDKKVRERMGIKRNESNEGKIKRIAKKTKEK